MLRMTYDEMLQISKCNFVAMLCSTVETSLVLYFSIYVLCLVTVVLYFFVQVLSFMCVLLDSRLVFSTLSFMLCKITWLF